MSSKRDADDHPSERSPGDTSKPLVKAPWPDQKARQQMSETDAVCDNLGKHSKNHDWEKRW